jgi:predicted nucleic acid-binding protein
MILLDTNLLGRITDSRDPQCSVARHAISSLFRRGDQLAIVPQNLYEFWAIATRAKGAAPTGENGLGMSIEQASQWVRFFQRRFTLLADRNDLVARWLSLVTQLRIKGFRTHDARLVAAMQSYGIARILTFNARDFANLPVTLVDPAAV